MNSQLKIAAERIYFVWDDALQKNDMDTLLKLYHDNAVLESPLVSHLLNIECGICHGKEALKAFFALLAQRKPLQRQYYRKPFFTDGKTLLWEYPRATPDGDQMDFMEVMELNEGLIAYHRIYWGWYGFNNLKQDAYRC